MVSKYRPTKEHINDTKSSKKLFKDWIFVIAMFTIMFFLVSIFMYMCNRQDRYTVEYSLSNPKGIVGHVAYANSSSTVKRIKFYNPNDMYKPRPVYGIIFTVCTKAPFKAVIYGNISKGTCVEIIIGGEVVKKIITRNGVYYNIQNFYLTTLIAEKGWGDE